MYIFFTLYLLYHLLFPLKRTSARVLFILFTMYPSIFPSPSLSSPRLNRSPRRSVHLHTHFFRSRLRYNTRAMPRHTRVSRTSSLSFSRTVACPDPHPSPIRGCLRTGGVQRFAPLPDTRFNVTRGCVRVKSTKIVYRFPGSCQPCSESYRRGHSARDIDRGT